MPTGTATGTSLPTRRPAARLSLLGPPAGALAGWALASTTGESLELGRVIVAIGFALGGGLAGAIACFAVHRRAGWGPGRALAWAAGALVVGLIAAPRLIDAFTG